MSLVVVTEPDTEPVTVAEAKAHLRVTHSEEDAYIAALIIAARRAIENNTGRRLITQTLASYADFFPHSRVIRLEGGPIQEITSIKYLDTDGDEQTFAEAKYTVDIKSTPARIILNSGESWPTTWTNGNACIVNYIVGYGDDGSFVPVDLKQAILFLVGHWFAQREPVTTFSQPFEVPKTVEYLVAPYIIWGC